MKLGILVNTDKHLDEIIGLTRAAAAKGHEVDIFAMDAGTRLLETPSYGALTELQGVTMSYCDHSAKDFQVKTDALSEKVVCSSQYSNASMNHTADKVVVF